MSKGDEIDELVSSVRNFVTHKDMVRMASPTHSDKLVLTADSRLSDEQVKAIDAEWQAELRALETAGLVAPGKAQELSLTELEEAVAKLPEDWETANPDTTVSEEAERAPAKAGDSAGVTTTQPDDHPATVVDMAEVEALISARIGDLIDDEALRALVVRTVHQELGGELGERITRNVRKMVRREINRVLTSRDLSGE